MTCDVAVRQAINYGVDRERMIYNVMNGFGTVAYSVSDGMPWYSPYMACEYDAAKAAQLLDDAGWVPGGAPSSASTSSPGMFTLRTHALRR